MKPPKTRENPQYKAIETRIGNLWRSLRTTLIPGARVEIREKLVAMETKRSLTARRILDDE